MKKTFYLIIAIFIILAFGYYFYDRQNRQAQAPTNGAYEQTQEPDLEILDSKNKENQIQNTAEPTNTSTPRVKGEFSSGEGENLEGPDVRFMAVDFNGTEFSPTILDIQVNDYVFFRNNSQNSFWPRVEQLDTYPEFNAGKAIKPGESFKFEFTKAGQWAFFDQLKPQIKGVIRVNK